MMQKNKLLFAILIFLSFTVKPSTDLSDLEDGILNSDVEKVKEILDTVTLSEHDKVGLIDVANDMVLKRLKEVECLAFGRVADKKEYEKVELGRPTTLTILGLLGAVVAPNAIDDKNDVIAICAVVVTIISWGACIGGFLWLTARIQSADEKIRQSYPHAMKIKKLIHDKVCIA